MPNNEDGIPGGLAVRFSVELFEVDGEESEGNVSGRDEEDEAEDIPNNSSKVCCFRVGGAAFLVAVVDAPALFKAAYREIVLNQFITITYRSRFDTIR